jgi:hypothetical protein
MSRHTSWRCEDKNRSPDILHASVDAKEAFGSGDLLESAKVETIRDEKRKSGLKGQTAVKRRLRRLAEKRCEAAIRAILLNIPREQRDVGFTGDPLRPTEVLKPEEMRSRIAEAVRKWWELNFRILALRELLFDSGLEVPPNVARLRVPESWEGRKPKPARDAEHVFEGRSRVAGANTRVPDEVRKRAASAFEELLEHTDGVEAAKDKVLNIAESHDYRFSRRSLERWIDDSR